MSGGECQYVIKALLMFASRTHVTILYWTVGTNFLKKLYTHINYHIEGKEMRTGLAAKYKRNKMIPL